MKRSLQWCFQGKTQEGFFLVQVLSALFVGLTLLALVLACYCHSTQMLYRQNRLLQALEFAELWQRMEPEGEQPFLCKKDVTCLYDNTFMIQVQVYDCKTKKILVNTLRLENR